MPKMPKPPVDAANSVPKDQRDLSLSLPVPAPVLRQTPGAGGVVTNSMGPSTDICAPLQFRKLVRIAVSGDVLLTQLELDIIDSADFQRLRGVRQLGTVCLVYPTALHTRFDHSLGVLEMASRIVQAIRGNTHSTGSEKSISVTQERLVRLYALLHDITHVPFGHTVEDELGILERHDENEARITRFLGPESRIGALLQEHLGDECYRRLLSIYRWHGGKHGATLVDPDDAFIYDIVSNTVCADLLDYVARDSYFCNLGISLEYRFVNFLYIGMHQGQRRTFVRLWKPGKPTPRRDTLTDLARLLEARYLVAERAYFHHAKITTGAMLARALQEAMILGEIREEALYDHSDDTLLKALRGSKSTTGAGLAQALHERRLHRVLQEYGAVDFEGRQQHDHDRDAYAQVERLATDPAWRRQLEDTIAEEVGAQHGDVLLYAPPRRKGMNMKAAEMLVLWRGQGFQLKDVDDAVIRPRLQQIIDAHQALWGVYILVSRTLDDSQRKLVRDACYIRLLSQDKKPETGYYRDVIRRGLATSELDVTMTPDQCEAAIASAADELSAISHDPRPFSQRLADVYRRFFGAGRR